MEHIGGIFCENRIDKKYSKEKLVKCATEVDWFNNREI